MIPLQPQAVLFDLDGTLLDTAPDFVTSTQALLAQHGRDPMPEKMIRNAVTNGSRGIVEKVFQLEANDPSIEPLRQELVELYFQRLHERTRPFDGIPQTLNALREKSIPWGIVTNKPARFTDAILERLPFDYPPESVVCPDHVSNTKPHPESILLACEQLSVDPAKTVTIGDHARDVAAGRAAGSTTIAALYGYIDPDEPIDDWQADYRASSAHDLMTLLFP